MLDVYLDPFVLACPQPDEGLEQLERYVNNIISWNELIHAKWLQVCVSKEALNILIDTNSYPPWDTLNHSIRILGVHDIQPQDVMTLVEALLKKLPHIETRLNISAILIDNIDIEPTSHIEGRAKTFIEHYHHLSILMCFAEVLEPDSENEAILITRGLSDYCVSIAIGGEVVDCEFMNTSSMTFPIRVSGNFSACQSLHGLQLCVNPINLWANANSDKIAHKAIAIYLHQRIHQPGITGTAEQDFDWSFGSRFIDTARDLGFLHEPGKIERLLRACAETILGESLESTHELRTGKGANNPQQKRGNDGAWRRDIDYEYHLHYWQTPNGPEFAKVALHKDMTIPE